ncbi:MAG TPA: glycosyl hydrolase family 18 protein [Candidatus Dormibacteraeota bacterium]
MTGTHRVRTRVAGAAAVLAAVAIGLGTTSSARSHQAAAAPSLPAHIITGYWQDFTNGATPMRLKDVSSNYDLVAVAFANADPSTPGGVTFGVDSGLSSALGGYTDAQLTSDVQALHSQGREVVISVGGQNGAISVNDATSAGNFANSVSALMRKFGFDGVDIDLENGISPSFMASALQQLSSMAGPSLVITLAPQTLDVQPGGAYLQLIDKIKSILTVVNTQYYNSGTMNGCDGIVYAQGSVNFITAQACILLQHVRADQVGLGLPASGSAAGSGAVAPSVVNAALDCLASGTSCGSFVPPAKNPSIRGAMTWSVNWDASNGNQFGNTVHPHLATLGGGGQPTPTPTPRPTATPTPTPGPTATPTPTPPPPTGGNLVSNPGFETGGFAPWSCAATDSVVSGNAHSGMFALSAAANNSDFAQCTQTIAVQPNHAYTLSAFVQGSYAFIGVTGTGTTDVSNFAPSAPSYTKLSVAFSTGAATTAVSIYVHGWYAQGTILADDFSVS